MHRGTAPTSLRFRRGFTMLELLVVGIVGVIVLMGIANCWRWYSKSVHATQVSTQLTKELKLAADAFAADYGPALAARSLDGTTIQFDIDANADGIAQWSEPDLVIEYTVQGENLIRHDLNTDAEVPMAAHIQSLTAETVVGKLQAHLVAGFRADDEHDITLVFQE